VENKADKLNRILELLGGSASGDGSLREVCTALTSRKNTEQALAFSRTPYSARLLLLPQCLRATGRCVAKEETAEYVCAECGSCKIAAMSKRAAELGYLGVRILKGGSAVGRLLEHFKPQALLGVACSFEGAIGMVECERRGVAVQFVPLLKDGCADTDVDLEEVLEFRQP
jgi:hypothetical protein